MRIYASRCHSFAYRTTVAGPCAIAIEPSAIGTTRPFFDCLVLSVGVDRGDLDVTRRAAIIVKQIATRTDPGFIVIDGFARWATASRRGSAGLDVLTGLADALDVLHELSERLEERGELVHQMPFGWNKFRRAHVVDGAWAYRVIDVGPHTPPPLPALTRPNRAITPRALPSCGAAAR